MTGSEFKQLYKALGFTQKDLIKMWGTSAKMLRRVEASTSVSRSVEALARTLPSVAARRKGLVEPQSRVAPAQPSQERS